MKSLRFAFALVAGLSTLARAQQAADSARDTARVARVVVTATRSPLAVDRVPASVTVIDGATLRSQGITHVADALKLVPGVAVVQSGSYGAQTSLFVRGGQSNYTKVLVDGVPVNDPGGALDLGTLTVDDIERIEVVRGPSSVVYGSDAVTGVVQIFTRRGGATPHASFGVRGGTYGSYDVDGTADGGAGSARASIGVAHHAGNGIYDFNSRYRNDVGDAALSLVPWSGADLRATARYSDVNAHFPTDFTGAPIDPNAYRTEKRTLLGAELDQRIGRATATLGLTSNLTDAATIDPPNNAGEFGSTTASHTRRQSADLRVAIPVATVATLSVGGAFERQHLASPDTGRDNSAAYLELVRDAGATTAALGARLDHSDTYGDFGTYRLSLARILPGAFRARASLGTAFREPAFYESFDTPFSVANPSLRPERTTSWELGVEHPLIGDVVSAGATYFDQRFVDLIDYLYAPSGSMYENVAEARASGAEVELRMAPVRRVTAEASYTFVDTKVLKSGFDPSPLATLHAGSALLRRPKQSASAGVAWRHENGILLDVRATFVGRRDDRLFHGAPDYETDAVTLDPYTKVDISAALPLGVIGRGLSPFSLTLRIDDAFATRYQSVAGYAAPGRVLMVGVRI